MFIAILLTVTAKLNSNMVTAIMIYGNTKA